MRALEKNLSPLPGKKDGRILISPSSNTHSERAKEMGMIRNATRFLLSSLLSFLLAAGAAPAAQGDSGHTTFCEKVKPCELLLQSEAERLLGQPARLTQNTSSLRGDIRQCLCAYVGVSKDKVSGQDCMLFFSLEENEAHPSAEQARQVLISTKEANEHDTTVLDFSGIGDQAFLLSNDDNSHLIMARKGSIIMRLQVKNSTARKSSEELKTFAERAFKRLAPSI